MTERSKVEAGIRKMLIGRPEKEIQQCTDEWVRMDAIWAAEAVVAARREELLSAARDVPALGGHVRALNLAVADLRELLRAD